MRSVMAGDETIMLFNTGAYARAGVRVRMYRDPRQDVAQEMEGN